MLITPPGDRVCVPSDPEDLRPRRLHSMAPGWKVSLLFIFLSSTLTTGTSLCHVVDLLDFAWLLVMFVFFFALIIFRVKRIAANLSNLKCVEQPAQHNHSCNMPSFPCYAMMFYATENTEKGQ